MSNTSYCSVLSHFSALQSMYEQQLASMAGLSANPAAASMFGYNPFLMSAAASPFASLAAAGGFGGLGSAAALGSGLAGLGAASDYQAAAAAAAMSANFPSMAGRLMKLFCYNELL